MLNKNVHFRGDDTYTKPRDFIVILALTMRPVIVSDIEIHNFPSRYLLDEYGKVIYFTNEAYAKQFVGKLNRNKI